MVSEKLRETKEPFIVWFFVVSYSVILIVSGSSSKQTLAQDITIFTVLNLLIATAIGRGPILAFLVIFLAWRERQRSLMAIFSSVGLRRKGSAESVLWCIALLPLFLATISLMTIMLTYFLGPISFAPIPVPSSGQVQLWYPYCMIIYSFFPVAVVEEAIGRGYMLDRLMSQHPSNLTKALPAIFLDSLLCTLYHLPAYLRSYSLSLPWVIDLLAGNIFPWSLALSISYVRARTRNIIGPVLIHFLADAMPYILMLA